jgi:hypothetical protein
MTLANWRDLALIEFIVIGIIIALVPGALLGGMAYGLRILKRKMMPYIKLIQHYARRTAHETDRIATMTVRPIITTAATGAQVEHHITQIFNRIAYAITKKEPQKP